MKATLTPAIIIVVFFSIFSCTSKQKTSSPESNAGEEQLSIQLDNGKPWLANAETTTGIQHMQMLVNNFPDDADLTTCRVLKSELETKYNFIFEKCTMTGEAHEQLHAYLLPMKDMISRVDSQDPEVSKAAVAELKKHLALYGKYFT